jgi:3-hydroxyacyl-CoA dehydrogenase
MGGGGGSDGFKHLLEHLGPATQAWQEDMRTHAFTWAPKDLDALSASVAEELRGKDVKELERKRDDLLVGILGLKK